MLRLLHVPPTQHRKGQEEMKCTCQQSCSCSSSSEALLLRTCQEEGHFALSFLREVVHQLSFLNQEKVRELKVHSTKSQSCVIHRQDIKRNKTNPKAH